MVEGAFSLHRWEMERHRREDAAVPKAQINPAWRHTKQRRAAELTRILDEPQHPPSNGSISPQMGAYPANAEIGAFVRGILMQAAALAGRVRGGDGREGGRGEAGEPHRQSLHGGARQAALHGARAGYGNAKTSKEHIEKKSLRKDGPPGPTSHLQRRLMLPLLRVQLRCNPQQRWRLAAGRPEPAQ